MISVTSVTDKYILQPPLVEKHKRSLEWLSATLLWRHELNFFQKLLDEHASKFTSVEEKKKIDHFQNLIIYYKAELVSAFSSRLRMHEKHLADMLETRDETLTIFFKEHDGLMDELESFSKQFKQFKDELYAFIEKVM